ncbi:MAG: efflux RND transporter periplasmic adaptor subunit [Muribaculaceae bacterium]|nr:efflux RND transporter periplasmic adaptor subunit [Muribaculaceae bacterium]
MAGVAAIIPMALISCSKEEAKPTLVTSADDELPIVDVDVVYAADVAQTKQYTANVEAFNSNNISPATMNRIKSINVEVGDRVNKGQVLATLDQSAITQLKVNLDQIEREYNRALQLLNIGSGTQAAVDQYKAQLDAARTQYDNLLENTVLTSPVSGVVTARNYDPGDMSGTMPILTVGQINPAVKIIINITENDLGGVKTGMPVDVTFDAFPGEDFKGKIVRIYPNIDPATRTFQAEVQVNNPQSRLFPGMFARVSLDHGTANHVVVPDRAVVKQTGSGNRYVYVYNNGRVSYNKVELGRQDGNRYEILSGVNDGDTVVIAGQTRLADGVEVQLKEK